VPDDRAIQEVHFSSPPLTLNPYHGIKSTRPSTGVKMALRWQKFRHGITIYQLVSDTRFEGDSALVALIVKNSEGRYEARIYVAGSSRTSFKLLRDSKEWVEKMVKIFSKECFGSDDIAIIDDIEWAPHRAAS
jgi:hypothetical protein